MFKHAFAAAVIVCILIAAGRAGADEINFSGILSHKTAYKGGVVYSDEGTVRTADTSEIASLAAKCSSKGIKSGIDAHTCCEFLIDMYKGHGVFRKGISSDEPADPVTSANAFMAIGENYGSMQQPLKSKADGVINDILKTKAEPMLSKFASNEHIEKDGVKAPAWLIDGRGDASSLYLIAICRSDKLSSSHKDIIKMLAEGIRSFTNLKYAEFPFCAHYESIDRPNLFTLSANRQSEALCLAGKRLGDKSYTNSARAEADNFSIYLLSSYGPICGMAPAPVIYPQTSHGAMVFTENLAAIGESLGENSYMKLAGLASSWFYKGNLSGKNIYDPKTGKASDCLTQEGPSVRHTAKAAAEAISAIVSIYGTEGWKYRTYTAAAPSHAFKILQAEEGKAVRKDYEITSIEYPGDQNGSLVEIKRENSFWIKVSIDEDDEYAFHLCYLKQMGFGTSTSILMRIDGDKIYSVPLGGSPDDAYMFMQEVLERRVLQTGLHSMGIKFSGLLLGKAATLDCVTLQPLAQRKTFIGEDGNMISIVKSFHSDDIKYDASKLEKDGMEAVSCSIYSNGFIKTEAVSKDSAVRLPSYGHIIFEGRKKQ
ncbi:MAG: hypothetical protein MJ234_04410 [bacterium]|nr:hypothetical protein [bacterium]